LNWKENFVFVSEVHQGPEREALGHRKLKRAGGDSLRKRPLDVRWFARVARILPIDVPAGFKLEVEPRVVRSARAKLGIRCDKLHVHMR
jgi:hypothetical protein